MLSGVPISDATCVISDVLQSRLSAAQIVPNGAQTLLADDWADDWRDNAT